MAMNVMALRQQNIALSDAEKVIRTQFQYDLENSEVSQYLSEALGAAYATPIERKVGQEFQQAEWHRLVFMDMLGNYHEQGKWKLKNKTVKVMCEFWA